MERWIKDGWPARHANAPPQPLSSNSPVDTRSSRVSDAPGEAIAPASAAAPGAAAADAKQAARDTRSLRRLPAATRRATWTSGAASPKA